MRAFTLLALAGVLATTNASAVVITYTTGPDSLETVKGVSITGPGNGLQNSSYDRFNNPGDDGTGLNAVTRVDAGCGLTNNSQFNGVSASQFSSQLNFANTSKSGVRLNPYGQGSSNCFATVGDETSDPTLPTSTSFSSINGNSYRYIGFYWGSVDSWNTLSVSDGTTNIALPRADINGVLSGTTAATAARIAVDTATAIYINMYFTAAENATTITIGNTNNFAFEFTNLALSQEAVDGQPANAARSPMLHSHLNVPEPAGLAVLLAGMGALGLARRRRG